MRHASAPGQSATIFFFQKKRWWVDASYLPLLKHMLLPGFLRVVLENNLVFYGLSWRSQFGNVSLALSKNHAFYVLLRFKGFPGTEKITCQLRVNALKRWNNLRRR